MSTETQQNATAMKIKQLRKDAGLSQQAFGDKIGVSKSAVSLFESGANKPKLDTLNKIAAEFGVTVDWLIAESDRNGGRSVSADNTARMLGSVDDQDYVELPFVPISAYGSFMNNCIDPHNEEFSMVRILRMSGTEYAKATVIEVKGNSMATKYPHGCRVVARPVSDGNWQHSLGVHAISLRSQMFVIKRITSNQNGILELTSDSNGEKMTIELGDILCMWKVGEKVFEPAED